MNHKLFTFFGVMVLAMLFVLLDCKEALAFPDLSEIKNARVVETVWEWVKVNPGKAAGGAAGTAVTEYVLKPIRRTIGWINGDGFFNPK